MDFPDPVVALRDYAVSKSYLKDSPSLRRRRLGFERSLLSTEARQNFWQGAFTFFGLLAYGFACGPLILTATQQLSPQFAALLSVLTVPLGGYLTAICVQESSQLRHAMRLVKAQNDLARSYELVDGRDDDERD